jgi:signal transduction histidine kinase/ActR/RegA family two-component response regulator
MSDDASRLIFERERIYALLDGLESMAGGDVRSTVPISPARDELDALAFGINALADELRWANARMNEAERRTAEEWLRAKERAERANEAKSIFLRTASHEIRTPIAAILGIADLLSVWSESEEDRADLVDRLRANSRALLTLVSNVLDLSRLEANKIELTIESVSLLDLLSEVVHSLEAEARKKRLSVSIETTATAAVMVETDRMRLRQILVNLVANAVKFTARGGVVIALREERIGVERRITIDVSDTGIGIDVNQREHLFEPFGQADPSVARAFGGSGLGLALSSRLAEQLGGRLVLLTSEPGRGSVFRLTLETLNADAIIAGGHDVDARNKRGAPKRVLEGMRVLLADDNPDLQLAIGRSLEMDGASVSYASNGHEVIEMAWSNSFDVVLLDLVMPVMNGLAAARLLRERGYRTPIIAISADASPETLSASIDAGCNTHLCKPFEPSDLTASIRFLRREAFEIVAD